MIGGIEGEIAPGEVVVVALEGDASVLSHHRQQVPKATGEIELSGLSLPAGFVGGGVEQIAADQEAIANSADPCTAWADVHAAEEIVGGIRDERAVFGVGSGEGDCGAGVFEY